MTSLLLASCVCAALAAWCWRPTPVRRGPLCGERASIRWRSVGASSLRRRRATSQAREIGALCSGLASELRSGQPPEGAWSGVLSSWSGPLPGPWLPGCAVVTVLTRWARVPGWGGLAALAVCWRVADDTGAGLAEALDRIGDAMRHEYEVAAEVHGQLSSVRATAVVLLTLPAVAVAMGHVLGAHPLSVLFGSVLGVACLGVGALFGIVGWWWLTRQVEGVREALRW